MNWWWREEDPEDPVERFRWRAHEASRRSRDPAERRSWRLAVHSVERAIEEAARAEKEGKAESAR